MVQRIMANVINLTLLEPLSRSLSLCESHQLGIERSAFILHLLRRRYNLNRLNSSTDERENIRRYFLDIEGGDWGLSPLSQVIWLSHSHHGPNHTPRERELLFSIL